MSETASKVVTPAARRRPPNAGKGRRKGVPNKTTSAIKDAALIAATELGSDGSGKQGLVGYFKMLGMTEPRAFAGVLARIIPLQVAGDPNNPIVTEIVQRIVDPQ
jgi:hypothetical protein